ncbi:LOW QUALITY PROTEIN: pre-mRNA-splicing regulator WTAP [Schistocerca piceifrons]|uniref:LOW QUALITY PROTEIN: pre-mRNA-splicing regulator WTAP n=1 Tax=Schistocerca piceifrons TaxID=274613 RepID=UPI001F5F8864|nr:LOW QUALITY PROTEIN: pre-mRNA-splicing regulator WTAP [Schistocerca piceifrons]
MADEGGVILTSPASGVHGRHSRRIKLSDQQLESITREELVRNWRELDSYVDVLESQVANQEAELNNLRESEDRIRQQHIESSHREKVLVRRLATKEQEMQEYANQIAELKAAQAPGATALRTALLDPSVNLLLQRLRQELLSTRARLEETQNELSAWKFTPDSNTGKRLMAKCRLLIKRMKNWGRMISSGRLAKLEGDLALQKSFSEEVKKSQSELDEFLQDLDEDVEGMQGTIYFLQQELRKAKESNAALQQENSALKSGGVTTTEHNTGLRTSEVGRESRPRTPLCHNGIREKGEDDSRGWDERTQGSDRPLTRDTSSSQSPGTENAADRPAGRDGSHPPQQPPPEEDSVSCDARSPEDTRLSPQRRPHSQYEESNDSTNVHSSIPPRTSQNSERNWQKVIVEQDDSSSDSSELILKIESEDIADDDLDPQSSDAGAETNKVGNSVNERDRSVPISADRTADRSDVIKEQSRDGRDSPSSRKRTCSNDDSSNDSDNVPLIKKVRRDSEISLHYNEEEDDAGLTNGESGVSGSRTSGK